MEREKFLSAVYLIIKNEKGILELEDQIKEVIKNIT